MSIIANFFRGLALWVTALVAVAVPSAVVAPNAAASCLTTQDAGYVTLLARKNIGPAMGYNVCDMALGARQIADGVRYAPNPLQAAVDAANEVYYGSNLTMDQATYEVATAIVVYAPEILPAITGAPPGDRAALTASAPNNVADDPALLSSACLDLSDSSGFCPRDTRLVSMVSPEQIGADIQGALSAIAARPLPQ